MPAEAKKSFFNANIDFFNHVSNKDIVVLSRQMATLFEAQVSALRIFRLLARKWKTNFSPRLSLEVADDLQAVAPFPRSLAKHPKVFSDFYVNMVKSGEESGKLDEIFLFLADYLDRTYAVTPKPKTPSSIRPLSSSLSLSFLF